MPIDSPQENPKSAVQWVVFLWSALFCLALFWSVDSSVFYLLLGVVVYSFFKVIQLRAAKASQENDRDDPVEPAWSFNTEPTDAAPKADSFLSSLSPQQKKIALTYILGFVGFVFFFILVGTLIDWINSFSTESLEYQQRASDFYMNQQYDSAVYYYGLALQADPENPDLWLERGNSFLYVPNADSSLAMYQRALELDPAFEQAQYNIGLIYFERKNYLDAIQQTRKILGYNPDYTEAKLLIGDCFYNRSQLDSALQYYESAYQSGYRSAILCHLIAYIYDTKGETPLAIDFYKEAIGQDSSIVDIYVRLGELVPGEEGNWFREKSAYLQSQPK